MAEPIIIETENPVLPRHAWAWEALGIILMPVAWICWKIVCLRQR